MFNVDFPTGPVHMLTAEKGVHQFRSFLLKNTYCCLHAYMHFYLNGIQCVCHRSQVRPVPIFFTNILARHLPCQYSKNNPLQVLRGVYVTGHRSDLFLYFSQITFEVALSLISNKDKIIDKWIESIKHILLCKCNTNPSRQARLLKITICGGLDSFQGVLFSINQI